MLICCSIIDEVIDRSAAAEVKTDLLLLRDTRDLY